MNAVLNRFRQLLLAACLLALVGCSGLTIEDGEKSNQTLHIEDYFQGNTRAHGVLFDRSGKATRQFTVDLHGHWDETQQKLTLDEDFVFNDGERSERQWRITRLANGQYQGEADDVEGVATGQSKGNALLWRYVLNIPYKGSTVAVNFEDWMFLSGDVLINRAIMRKFGFKVGEIVLTFERS